MNVRIIPCTECRRHRRKCVRPSFSHECLRCKKLGKICKQPTKQQDQQQESAGIDRSQDIIKLEKQVLQLEAAIRYMEWQLGMCSISNSNSNSSSPVTANAMIQSLFHSWKCKIANGTFQIETGIHNISELLQFNTSISYLSPLNYNSASSVSSDDSYYRGRDAGIVLNFEKKVNGSLIPFTITLMAKSISYAPSIIPTAVLIPSALLLDPKSLIYQLVDTYFQCNNLFSPLVHERSYRDRLAAIQDPLTDPVTLSICSYVCSTPCQTLSFTPRERRNMGDFFYAKARDIILDQFDIPEKQLETAMSINLLMQYMHITLKIGEARRLVSLAYQILVVLRNDYPDLRVPMDLDDTTNAPPDPPFSEKDAEEEPIENINKVLLARHLTIAAVLSRLLDYMMNDSSDKREFYFPSWTYIADEPESTKRFVRSQNWLIHLQNHKFVRNFLVNIHRLQLGRPCAFSFESILVMEELIKEYTAKIPPDIRLCADMNNMPVCFEAIDKTTDPVLLINFMHFHILQMSVYSCLMSPKASSDQGQQILSLVQEHSLSRALKSCQLLLRTIHRLAAIDRTSCNYLISANEYLFHAMDVLVILTMSPNKQMADEAGAMMRSCLKELQMIGSAQGDHMPQPDAALPDEKRFRMKDGKFDMEYYDKCPHPWFAIMYDTSQFFSK